MTMIQHSILAVDDDQEFLLYLQTALRATGCAFVPVETAADALAELSRKRFSLVLADLRLPTGSGLDVLQEARKIDPMTVGIVLTGHSSVDSALEALRDGAYDYLVKPCPPDQLLAAVRRGLEHHELRRALVEKTRQLESQERMIQDVSHELKNPLSVVYGYASFLLKQQQDFAPDELRKSLQSIHSNAERLGHLLEELLESSRLKAKRVELRRQAVSARALCEEARSGFAPLAAQKGVKLSADRLEDELVDADAKRVQQVLSNLISNALKFTPSGGSIAISCRRAGQSVEFSVADDGCGIAAADLERLFTRFYQVEATRKDHPGMGLGLEISKGLVELHGGKIWAQSEPGRGTTMLFTLPVRVLARA